MERPATFNGSLPSLEEITEFGKSLGFVGYSGKIISTNIHAASYKTNPNIFFTA